MADDNKLEPLKQLPDIVLAEVIREAELQVQAQLQTSTAADSRALTISGSCLTAATALFGAAAALSKGEPPDYALLVVAIALAISLFVAAGLAIHSARPIAFGFPGNEPESWLPIHWRDGTGDGYALKRARIEQAMVLQENIEDNRKASKSNAALVRAGLLIAYCATLCAAAAIIGILVVRA